MHTNPIVPVVPTSAHSDELYTKSAGANQHVARDTAIGARCKQVDQIASNMPIHMHSSGGFMALG